ncbi:leucine rich repeat family protein [Stylonychia lemnae]|uniref:Leucine rich repeat family protein n=1 Tax=Stylonychia lemnae TaxID=5949 RepID=A0A078AXW9_STYLE|nr:leucine rich repeat family protein [Stylonychia lemnae]|eukprot:CDW85638.1 leucine rich repeat family protein [Stylonychia lemnae]
MTSYNFYSSNKDYFFSNSQVRQSVEKSRKIDYADDEVNLEDDFKDYRCIREDNNQSVDFTQQQKLKKSNRFFLKKINHMNKQSARQFVDRYRKQRMSFDSAQSNQSSFMFNTNSKKVIENPFILVISNYCDKQHSNLQNLVILETPQHSFIRFINQFDESSFQVKILERIQKSLNNQSQGLLNVINQFIHESQGSLIDSKNQIIDGDQILFICRHQSINLNYKYLDKCIEQSLKRGQISFDVKYDKKGDDFQDKYQEILSKTQVKAPSKDSKVLQNKIIKNDLYQSVMQSNHSSFVRYLETPISQRRIRKKEFEEIDQKNSNLIMRQFSKKKTELTDNQYNFVTFKNSNYSPARFSILKSSQNKSRYDPPSANEQIMDQAYQDQNQQSQDYLHKSQDLLVPMNVSIDQKPISIETSNFPHQAEFTLQNKTTTILQKYNTSVNKTSQPFIPNEVTQQKKLAAIKKRLEKYRHQRAVESFQNEQIDQEYKDNIANFMKKHFENPDKIEKLESKLFKIPEARVNKSQLSRPLTKQLPKINRQNKSTFVLNKDNENDASEQVEERVSRSISPSVNLQSKFLDHIKNKKVINTFVDQELNYIVKSRPKDEVSQKITNKRLNISAFDPIRSKSIRQQKKNTMDYLKMNTFQAAGERRSLENVIRQNFKPLIKMNLPQLEQETGFTRRDLYNLYSHFLSILRIQQTERQHLKSDRIGDLIGVDFDIFHHNVPVIKYENREVAEKILKNIKEEIKEDQIRWADFLKYLRQILAKSFSEKIDIFFYAFDVDKNRKFSWNEVQNISINCLSQMFSSRDEFMESLSVYFTKYIFEAVGYDKNEEIPMDEIKHAIKTASGEQGDLLKMFVGAENFDEDKSTD